MTNLNSLTVTSLCGLEMERCKGLYKHSQANLLDRARTRRSEALCRSRQEKRMKLLDSRRQIPKIEEIPSAKKVDKRAEKLAKWKAEKQKLMAELKKNQKPVFKVGILQRKATGSPLLKMTNAYASKNFLKPNQLKKINKEMKVFGDGVMTRAKSKALTSQNVIENVKISTFAQIENNQLKQIKNHAFTVPKSVSNLASTIILQPPPQKKNAKMINANKKLKGDANKMENIENIENIENNKNIKNIKNVKNNKNNKNNKNIENEVNEISEINEINETNKINEEKESEPVKEEPANDFMPIHYSPFVKISRGSEIKSAKKNKITLQLDVDKLIEKEEKELNCRLFSFRKYIECETNKLLDACCLWRKRLEEDSQIPKDVEEEILSLCGKTKLLTSDKFMQFKDLIEKCASKNPMVKVEDLQGYQDWVSIEVESLDKMFVKLEERRINNWMPDENYSQPQKLNEMKPQIKKTKKIKQTAARSKIREHIQAVRKLQQNPTDMSTFNQLQTWEEGKTPLKTPKKECSLLKEVLTSETKKRSNSLWRTPLKNGNGETRQSYVSGLEIIAATHQAKSLTPEKASAKKVLKHQPEDVSDVKTPLRGILKQAPGSPNASKTSVKFGFNSSSNKCIGLNERFFQPLTDEHDSSDLTIKMGDFMLHSPKNGRTKNLTSTPIRRSERLALK